MNCDKLIKELLNDGWEETTRKEMVYYKESEKSLLIGFKGRLKQNRRISLHIREYIERKQPSYLCYLYVDGSTIKTWKYKDITIKDINKVINNFCFQCDGWGKTSCPWWDKADKRCATHETHCDEHGVDLLCENGVRVCLHCGGKGTFENQKLDRQLLAMLNEKDEVVRYYRG